MSEKRFVLPDDAPVTMTGAAASRLIGLGSGDAALLYVYILKNRGELSSGEAARALRMTPERVSAAVAGLASAGLLSRGAPESAPEEKERPVLPADELPQYDTADIRRAAAENGEFSALASEMQRSLGRVLSSADLVKLFGIYDHLGLPPAVILMLTVHCAAECRRRYGEGRMPTMRFIETVAFTWEREGIVSIDAAEEYIKRRERLLGERAELERAVGITGRASTRSEREYLDRWLAMGHSADAVALAYDRTVLQTGRLAWKYMDKILSDWHAKGLHTAEAARQGDRRAPKQAAPQPTPAAAPDAAELQRMKKLLENIKNGQG